MTTKCHNQIWRKFINESSCAIKQKIYEIEFFLFLFFLWEKVLPLTCFLSIDTKDSEKGATSKVYVKAQQQHTTTNSLIKQNFDNSIQTLVLSLKKYLISQINFYDFLFHFRVGLLSFRRISTADWKSGALKIGDKKQTKFYLSFKWPLYRITTSTMKHFSRLFLDFFFLHTHCRLTAVRRLNRFLSSHPKLDFKHLPSLRRI